jgi:hypothetical protein
MTSHTERERPRNEPGEHGSGWPGRILGWARVGRAQVLLAVALVVALALVRAPLRKLPDALFVSDGFGYYVFLPSVLIDGDLDLSNQLARIPYEEAKPYYLVVPKTKRVANPFPVGPALLWAPFFAAAHLLVLGARMLGATISADGFGFWYELPVYVGSFLYGALGLWLIQGLLTALFSRTVAAYALVLLLTCTPLGYYLLIEPDMAHPTGTLSIALFAFLMWRMWETRDATPRAWAILGGALGLVAVIRPYSAVVAVAAVPLARRVFSREGRFAWPDLAKGVAVLVVASALVYAPQVIVSSVFYGHLLLGPPRTGYDAMRWLHPDILRLVISTFSLCPLLLAAAVGLLPLPVFARDQRHSRSADLGEDPAPAFLRTVRPLMLLAITLAGYVIASSPMWDYGESFGQRRMVDWSAFFGIGLASCLWASPGSVRRVLPVAVLVLGVAGIAVAALYTAKLLPQWGLAGLL